MRLGVEYPSHKLFLTWQSTQLSVTGSSTHDTCWASRLRIHLRKEVYFSQSLLPFVSEYLWKCVNSQRWQWHVRTCRFLYSQFVVMLNQPHLKLIRHFCMETMMTNYYAWMVTVMIYECDECEWLLGKKLGKKQKEYTVGQCFSNFFGPRHTFFIEKISRHTTSRKC